MTKRTEEAKANGKKLVRRRRGRRPGKGAVELREYEFEHPFAQLSGSDNIIPFETKRYVEGQALVVQRTGRGAEVPRGVFGDVLRLLYLGAPS